MSTEVIDRPGTDLGEVIIKRMIEASPERIFQAFMDPEEFVHFWGPVGCHTPLDRVVIEPRVGGRFESVMVADDGSAEYPVKAVFLEMQEPTHWSWREEESKLISSTTLTDLGGGWTELVVHQTDVPAAFRTTDALAGFNTALDKFEAYLAASR